MEGQAFFSFDNKKLHAYELAPTKEQKGVVQIIHGMGEHSENYTEFMEFLASQGFVVFCADHRAHGKTAENLKKIGVYDGDIFYDIVRDQIYISEYLKDKYNLPLFVVGHSFGSFIAQRYNELYKKHTALVLIGSSFLKFKPELILGKIVANLGVLLRGKNTPAKTIHNLTFKRYNNSFADKNWLTSDKQWQQKFKTNRYCNRIFSYNFYKYFFKGISHIYSPKNTAKLKPTLPILILSGRKDALNQNGSVKKLKLFYKTVGVNKVILKTYENSRHAILNEVNRQEVYSDILKFIEAKLPKTKTKANKKEKDKK